MNLPKKSCAHYGCPNLTSGKYCEAHVGDAPKRLNSRQRGYDNKWDKYARAYLARHQWCLDPHRRHLGRQVSATVVGHKVAFKGGKVKMWAHDNHIALCWPCNSYQCVVFEGGFGRTPAPMPQPVNPGGVKQ